MILFAYKKLPCWKSTDTEKHMWDCKKMRAANKEINLMFELDILQIVSTFKLNHFLES